jgi:sialate O-acetylesterase
MLNSIFSDNMMIQCDYPVKVWGCDAPGKSISVKLAGNMAETETNADGKWLLTLPALPSGQTCDMQVRGNEEQIIKNILAGDVWLCSGQSNMEFATENVKNAKEEMASADFPEIRFFNVVHKASLGKVDQVEGKWEVCNPETVKTLSGVGYFFAREIHQKHGKPIGLLHSSWGGTRVEAWMRKESLFSFDFMKKEIEEYEFHKHNCINNRTIKSENYAQNVQKDIPNKNALVHTKGKVEYEQKVKEYNKSIPKDPENKGYEKGYASASYDVSDWKTLDVPGWWTKQGLDFNGVLWYRTNVSLPPEWEGQKCVLHLGSCDKSDQSYFNNEKIGGLSIEEDPQAWCASRVYEIPSNLVKSGENTIAVRVFSNVHGGGIIGQPEDIFISLKNQPGKSISLAGKWLYKVEHNFGLITPPVQPFGEDNPNSPYILFDNMINPLLNFPIKGVLWYQGESNAINYQNYKELFSTMIKDWRKCWNIGDFPFYFVQLASYIAGSDTSTISPWGEIRQAQEDALVLENTGMAVTIDIGDPVDIHPTNKQDVGKRLALLARSKTYGESIEFSGPVLNKVDFDTNEIRISFTHANGLNTPENNPVLGLKIRTENSVLDVNAGIEGDCVVIKGEDFSNIIELSYAYSDCPQCNLYNDSGLPARPFKNKRRRCNEF